MPKSHLHKERMKAVLITVAIGVGIEAAQFSNAIVHGFAIVLCYVLVREVFRD